VGYLGVFFWPIAYLEKIDGLFVGCAGGDYPELCAVVLAGVERIGQK